MELNLDLRRLLVLAVLLGGFVLYGGFAPPDVPEGYFDAVRIGKAWRYCVLLYLAGAVSVSIVDHMVGTLDRTNLRFLYVILGIGLMAFGVCWMHTLRSAVSRPAPGLTLTGSAPTGGGQSVRL